MGLTWQDVVGHVAAPDFSDAASLITKGMGQLGTAVRDVVGGPEQRRQAQLAREMMSMEIQQKAGARIEDSLGQLSTTVKNDVKEKDMKAFGSAQSILEAQARANALAGKPFEEIFKSEAYQALPEGARAYGASHLSDAYLRGDETRMNQAERAADNARQAQRDRVNDAQWAASFAEQRRNNAESRAERADARAAAAALKPKVWKTGNDKTDKAMTILANTTGREWNEATGAAYEEADLSTLGKGYKNLGAVTEVFGKVNKERAAAGKPPLPVGVLKRLVDTGVGANSFIDGWNDVDDTAIKQTLEVAGDQFDTAYKGRDFYERLSGYVDSGARPDQKKVDEAFNSMFPRKQTAAPARKETKPLTYTPTFNNMGGSKY